MSLHTEINFESEICEQLGDRGWLYEGSNGTRSVPATLDTGYDRARAFYAAHDVVFKRMEKDADDGLVADEDGPVDALLGVGSARDCGRFRANHG